MTSDPTDNDDNQLVKHGFVTLVPPTPVPGEFLAVDIAASGAHLYVSGAEVGPLGIPEVGQVRCWDLSDHSSPIETSRAEVTGLGSTVRMVVSGGRVYLAANDAVLAPGGHQSPAIGAVDVSDPDAASRLGYWQLDDLGDVDLVAASSDDVVIKNASRCVTP